VQGPSPITESRFSSRQNSPGSVLRETARLRRITSRIRARAHSRGCGTRQKLPADVSYLTTTRGPCPREASFDRVALLTIVVCPTNYSTHFSSSKFARDYHVFTFWRQTAERTRERTRSVTFAVEHRVLGRSCERSRSHNSEILKLPRNSRTVFDKIVA